MGLDLMDDMAPLLGKRGWDDATGSGLSLRSMSVKAYEGKVSREWPDVGLPTVSTTLYKWPLIQPVVCRFGWAMTAVDLVSVRDMDQVDFHRWAQSIEENGSETSLESLCLDESLIQQEDRQPLQLILDRSPKLNNLELCLPRLDVDWFLERVRWWVNYLGSRVARLTLNLEKGTIHPKITSLLSRQRIPRLKELTVFFHEGDESDLGWLANLISTSPGSRSSSIRGQFICSDSAQSLRFTRTRRPVEDAYEGL